MPCTGPQYNCIGPLLLRVIWSLRSLSVACKSRALQLHGSIIFKGNLQGLVLGRGKLGLPAGTLFSLPSEVFSAHYLNPKP